MNTQLVTALNFEGAAVRLIQIDGEPWFVAADVCAVLTVATEQTRRLDDDEKGLRTVQTLGGPQEMLIINESGLYSLILTSRKPEAKRFKRWVTGEVLPTIRKTGGYGIQAAPSIDTDEGKLLMIQQLATKQLALIQENRQIAIERDHAVATKAHIGSKREATAMATASAAKKESIKLKARMGEATQSASVIAVEKTAKRKFGQQGWRKLKDYCTATGLVMGRAFNPGLQMSVNTYPAQAWFEVYGVDLAELFGDEVMA